MYNKYQEGAGKVQGKYQESAGNVPRKYQRSTAKVNTGRVVKSTRKVLGK